MSTKCQNIEPNSNPSIFSELYLFLKWLISTTHKVIIPAAKCKTCIKVIPIRKEVDTVLPGPVKYNPEAFSSLNPIHWNHTNKTPKTKVTAKKTSDREFLFFFSNR